jgi:hypothetical protein
MYYPTDFELEIIVNHHLQFCHYILLRHIHTVCGIYGWEGWEQHNNAGLLDDLEGWGLIKGSWFGSIEDDPRPHWQLSSAGEKALAAYEKIPTPTPTTT